MVCQQKDVEKLLELLAHPSWLVNQAEAKLGRGWS